MADARKVKPSQLALAWVLAHALASGAAATVGSAMAAAPGEDGAPRDR